MNQSQKQTRTCGNCASSEEAPKVDERNEDERKEVTCKKNLTPDPDDKNTGGVYIYADTPADKCPEWKAKED